MQETSRVGDESAVHRALGSPSRVRLLSLLRETGPADASQLAERTLLHPNTVRAHLDQLERARLVESNPEQTGRRGRPRVVFCAVAADPSPAAAEQGYRLIAESLAEAVLRRDGATAPLERVVRLLDELGFDPELEDRDGVERVLMHACPFLEEARANPHAVCGAHLGLVRDVFEAAAAEVEPALDACAGPAPCVLRLASPVQ